MSDIGTGSAVLLNITLLLHLLLASMALLAISVIDAKWFVISPQWVLIALVNIIAVQQCLGVSIAGLAIGTGFFGAVTLGYFLLFKQVRKSLGFGDLYMLPMFGLVFPSFIHIWSALICISALLITHHIYLTHKRGKKLFKGHQPLAPAFCTTFGVFLWVKYFTASSDIFQISASMYQVLVSLAVVGVTMASYAWFFVENIKTGDAA